MTDREKAIVMAHTGICMLAGEKFGVFHAYIEDIMGRPVYTHELAIQSISDEIKEKSRDDFIKLCKEEQEPCEDTISRQAVLDLIEHYNSDGLGSVFYGYEEGVKFADKVKKLPPITSQEPCEDAIRREDAINAVSEALEHVFVEHEDIAKKMINKLPSVKLQEPCEDAISRQAVLDAIDVKAWEFCDYLISKNRNDEQKPVSHFADNLRECVREELPPVSLQPKTGHWTRELIRNEKGGCIGAKMICSECGKDNKHDEYMNYCPNCGTKMQEVEK